MPHLTLLFIGDVFGKPGRDLVRLGVPKLVRRYEVTAVIANGENSAGGFGITRETGEELFASGIDLMTSGNHVWDKKEALDYLPLEPRLVRPANFPAGVPGNGSAIMRTSEGEEVARAEPDGPRLHERHRRSVQRSARARRRGCGRARRSSSSTCTPRRPPRRSPWAGTSPARSTAVVGTHTHVQTADEQILPGGTAYITDVGMTGPHDGIIGVEREPVINRFLTGLPARFEAAKGMPKLHAVVITADTTTGAATSIERISLTRAALEAM